MCRRDGESRQAGLTAATNTLKQLIMHEKSWSWSWKVLFTSLVCNQVQVVCNTPFTRWSWLDELARRALVEPASSCKRGISFADLCTCRIPGMPPIVNHNRLRIVARRSNFRPDAAASHSGSTECEKYLQKNSVAPSVYTIANSVRLCWHVHSAYIGCSVYYAMHS